MKTFICLFLMLLSFPAWSQDTKGAATKVTVELYDAKGAMIGEVQVEKAMVEQYTQERKAEGITVKQVVKNPPPANK